MPDLRAIVTIPFLSGLPEDVSVNVLHFSSASSDDAATDVIRNHVVELYNTAPPLGFSGNALPAISSYYSNACSRAANACSVKVYDLADAMPRVPRERLWTLGPSSNAAGKEVPAEVAVVGSIYSGLNRPRQRGRVFFGPFHEAAMEDDPSFQRGRPALLLRDAIFSALRRLATKAANTQNLAVYSRVDGVMRVVDHGWVDDAWDTQRRRGQEAAGRNAW